MSQTAGHRQLNGTSICLAREADEQLTPTRSLIRSGSSAARPLAQGSDQGLPRARRISRGDMMFQTPTDPKEREMAGADVDMKLEVVTVPVSDVDRAKRFYQSLGWRLDADIVRGDNFRAVQLTPPHSACSVAFGKGLTTGEPGSVKRLLLAVEDIEAAREDVAGCGV